MNLTELGWTHFFEKHKSDNHQLNTYYGRIANVQKNLFLIYSEMGENLAKLAGAFSHKIQSKAEIPVVGDWVMFSYEKGDETAIIHEVLPRMNVISRGAAGSRSEKNPSAIDEQVIASNIDVIFIVCGLDRDFNLRRIERYLSLVYSSGATPVIVLNKADICPDYEERRLDVESVAIGVPIQILSAHQGDNIDSIKQYLLPGITATLLGSSGAGKSTIINSLLGFERQKTKSVSDQVGKGVHTTTSRELIPLPNSGLIIDTPGMRELQLLDATEGVEAVFEEIETLSDQCRFADCSHTNEPGCAVIEALQDGTITEERVQSYQKLKREQFFLAEREHKSTRTIEKEKWRKIKIMHRKTLKNSKF